MGIQFGGDDENVAVVQSVIEDSAAANAGIQPGGRILKVNDYDVTSHWSVVAAVAQSRAGDEVSVVVEHDGNLHEKTVTLTAQKEHHIAFRNLDEPGRRNVFGFRDGKLVPMDIDGEWSVEEFQKMFGDKPPGMDMVVPFAVPKPRQLDRLHVERSKLEETLQKLEEEKKRQDARIRELTEKIESLRSDAHQQQTDRLRQLIEEMEKRIIENRDEQ